MEITIKDDFIKLGQALKLAGLVDSGVDAKFVIQDGQVKVCLLYTSFFSICCLLIMVL